MSKSVSCVVCKKTIVGKARLFSATDPDTGLPTKDVLCLKLKCLEIRKKAHYAKVDELVKLADEKPAARVYTRADSIKPLEELQRQATAEKKEIATIFYHRPSRTITGTLSGEVERIDVIEQFRDFKKQGLMIPDIETFPGEYKAHESRTFDGKLFYPVRLMSKDDADDMTMCPLSMMEFGRFHEAMFVYWFASEELRSRCIKGFNTFKSFDAFYP